MGHFLQSDWDIVKRGYYAHVLGEAPRSFTDPLEAVRALRVRSSLAMALLPNLMHV